MMFNNCLGRTKHWANWYWIWCLIKISECMSCIALRIHPKKGIRTRKHNVRRDLADLPQSVVKASRTYLNFSVAALNIVGDLNLSMIVRISEAMGAKEFHFLGYRKIDPRGFVGVNYYMPISREKEPIVIGDGIVPGTNKSISPLYDFAAFRKFIEDHRYYPIYIEQPFADMKCHEISQYGWDDIPIGLTPCLIFGNEGHGIPKKLVEDVKGTVVHIDQIGVTRSLNVSASAIIAIHHASMHFKNSAESVQKNEVMNTVH